MRCDAELYEAYPKVISQLSLSPNQSHPYVLYSAHFQMSRAQCSNQSQMIYFFSSSVMLKCRGKKSHEKNKTTIANLVTSCKPSSDKPSDFF